MQAEQHLQWEAVQNGDRITLQLIGALSRDTLLPFYQQWLKRGQRDSFFAQTQRSWCWDLSQIQRIDSAGFAFLCDIVVDLQRANKVVMIENAPAQLTTLADLFGLATWLKPILKSVK